MPFRIHGQDLASGHDVAAFEVRQETEADARVEARRLGIRVLRLEPIEVLSIQARIAEERLWHWPGLRWHTSRWGLLMLALEHPRWGAQITAPMLLLGPLLSNKFTLTLLVSWISAALLAVGLHPDREIVALGSAICTLLVPTLVLMAVIHVRLRPMHAADGFGRERRFSVVDGKLRWFDGSAEHTLHSGELRCVYRLYHAVLITMQNGREIVIPRSAFRNRDTSYRFEARMTQACHVRLHTGFIWEPKAGQESPTLLQYAALFLVIGILVAVWLVFIFLLLLAFLV